MDLSKYKQIISFVNQTIIIGNNVQNEKLTRGEKFNVFNVLGLWSEEVQLHSRFLSELLNPKGSHGLKDAFLKAFIKQIALEKLCIDTLNCEIKIEYNIGSVTEENGGRIDILITDNDKAIIIENKIYAKDQSNQLLRYNNFGCSNYKDKYCLLYLTLNGDKASQNSTGIIDSSFNYEAISYRHDIIEWLETCLQMAHNQPLVRETIRQYQTLIKQLTNQDMDNKNKEELINLLSQEENFEAVSVIANLYDNVLKKVIENKLFPELREIANDLGLDFSFSENKTDTEFELNHDPYGRKDFGFFFKTRNTSKIVIRYTFNEWNLNQLYWCIDENLSEKKDAQRLNIFTLSGAGFQWGWNWVKEYEDWNNQDTIKNVLNGGFIKRVKQDLSDLLQELREKNIINE